MLLVGDQCLAGKIKLDYHPAGIWLPSYSKANNNNEWWTIKLQNLWWTPLHASHPVGIWDELNRKVNHISASYPSHAFTIHDSRSHASPFTLSRFTFSRFTLHASRSHASRLTFSRFTIHVLTFPASRFHVTSFPWNNSSSSSPYYPSVSLPFPRKISTSWPSTSGSILQVIASMPGLIEKIKYHPRSFFTGPIS